MAPLATVHLIDVDSPVCASEAEEREWIRELIAKHGATLCLGVHAYRSGRFLRYSSVPYHIILGGTDINVMLHNAALNKVMLEALDRAVGIVAFSEIMKSWFVNRWFFFFL